MPWSPHQRPQTKTPVYTALSWVYDLRSFIGLDTRGLLDQENNSLPTHVVGNTKCDTSQAKSAILTLSQPLLP
jgi:hypothetical protein